MFSNTLKRHSGHFRFGPWLAGILSSSKPANDYYYCGIFQEFHFWHCNRSSNSCNLPDSKSVPQKTDIFGIPIDSISNDEIVLLLLIHTSRLKLLLWMWNTRQSRTYASNCHCLHGFARMLWFPETSSLSHRLKSYVHLSRPIRD